MSTAKSAVLLFCGTTASGVPRDTVRLQRSSGRVGATNDGIDVGQERSAPEDENKVP